MIIPRLVPIMGLLIIVLAVPLIMGKWCRRLVTAGFVKVETDRAGYYRSHQITDEGRAVLRRQYP